MTDFELSNQLYILMNVAIAAVLTGLIGLEREFKNKPAGFRTNMIVGSSAALLLSLGKIIVDSYGEGEAMGTIQADPTRIIEAIIVGISFIGAGTILKGKEEDKVYYLTTAATVLFSAGIGIAVALDQYVLAVTTTFFILVINRVAKLVYNRINN